MTRCGEAGALTNQGAQLLVRVRFWLEESSGGAVAVPQVCLEAHVHLQQLVNALPLGFPLLHTHTGISSNAITVHVRVHFFTCLITHFKPTACTSMILWRSRRLSLSSSLSEEQRARASTSCPSRRALVSCSAAHSCCCSCRWHHSFRCLFSEPVSLWSTSSAFGFSRGQNQQ